MTRGLSYCNSILPNDPNRVLCYKHKPLQPFKPACLWKMSLLHNETVFKPKFGAWLSWQHGWHTTAKIPDDEWLLKPARAYVSLFGLEISLNEDNNIACWRRLSVLFCLSISWHQTSWRLLWYTVTREIFLRYQSRCMRNVLKSVCLKLWAQFLNTAFVTFLLSWQNVFSTKYCSGTESYTLSLSKL